MPMMTYLAMHKPEFEMWQVYVIASVALVCMIVLVVGIIKIRKM